jgi:hypothetical protein
MMHAVKRSITLAETPSGWIWKEHGLTFGTLTRAVQAVKRDAKRLAKAGRPVIQLITYEPTTDAGRLMAEFYAKGN